jgi:very-short-patch-repair endonuclease
MKRMNLDRARHLRAGQTDAEQLLWHRLRNRRQQGWKFRRQHQIDQYIVDFVCPDTGLIVELDGGHHGDQVAYDEMRSTKLIDMGYRVLRFWNNDVLKNTDSVLEAILEALASPDPSPQPSPRRGEGVASTET